MAALSAAAAAVAAVAAAVAAVAAVAAPPLPRQNPIRRSGSFAYAPVPNCSAPDRVGCIGVPTTVLPPLAAWNGSLELAGDVADFLAASTLPGWRFSTRSTAVADVDGDGFMDIVLGNAAQNVLIVQPGRRTFLSSYGPTNPEFNQILFGSADGRTFSNVTLPGGSRSTTSTSVADVDGDGFMDIVLGNEYEENQVLFGSVSRVVVARKSLGYPPLDAVSGQFVHRSRPNSFVRIDLAICRRGHARGARSAWSTRGRCRTCDRRARARRDASRDGSRGFLHVLMSANLWETLSPRPHVTDGRMDDAEGNIQATPVAATPVAEPRTSVGRGKHPPVRACRWRDSKSNINAASPTRRRRCRPTDAAAPSAGVASAALTATAEQAQRRLQLHQMFSTQ